MKTFRPPDCSADNVEGEGVTERRESRVQQIKVINHNHAQIFNGTPPVGP